MSGGDIVMLSMKELRRLPVIHQVMEMRVTQVEAGRVLGLTARQIRRVIKRVWEKGEKEVAQFGGGRGSKGVLMAYIDDATGEVFGRFYEYEGTIPAMDSFMRYIKLYGIPQSIYLDKHTTYKSNAKPTIEDELNGRRPMSQFERALSELGVDVIHAHSPQAKGRIERLFGTFQDRVIKEMRLLGINSYEEANRILESYLPLHNQRFRVPA